MNASIRSFTTTDPRATLKEVATLMREQDIGNVLIMDGDTLSGIITDRDLVIRCMAEHKDYHACSARDLMTPSPRTVRDQDGLFDCINAMRDSQVRLIPVVDSQGKALGIVSFGDILGILSKEFGNLVENTTHPLETEKQPKKALAA